EILSCFCKIYVNFKSLFERSASYGLKSYILRKNKHSNPSPSISPFKITTKTFKGIKTINTFREYRCL
ncbi:hypothetical protein, partial [Clostridium botulinum]|uniref:hypothetical protein n=1 Tax=Clostridium botulinum TaxID=1491 RepID=UPI000A173D4A